MTPIKKLDLPESADVFVLCPDVLVIKKAFSWGHDLIDAAELVNKWNHSSQLTRSDNNTFVNDYRSSDSQALSIKTSTDFEIFERAFCSIINSAANFYRQYNTHFWASGYYGCDVLRYRTGQKFDVHIDVAGKGNESRRQLSICTYLNDDYKGGELVFPRQAIKYKPESGDVVMFPSNFCYPHASLPVIDGVKYAVVTWLLDR